ncbi:JMJD7 [Branchiostoma lanceolatum]|uniref:JMJD7 protein n=1 Tax=Branchiostoma lanceolatum TaxID=7740 RepID=A0A8J9ZMA7_BRALA|nr:JMJD7 [Branchiostoma lanceolatum]
MAPRIDHLSLVLKILFLFLALQFKLSSSLNQFSPQDVEMIIQDACIVAGVLPVNETVVSTLVSLERAFPYEAVDVKVGVIHGDFRWETGEKLKWTVDRELEGELKEVAFFSRAITERSYLIRPPKVKPRAYFYTESRSPEVMMEFLYQNCNAYRTLDGDLTFQGLHREEILGNIFHLSDVSSFTMGVKFGLTNTTEQCMVNSHTAPTEAETCGLYKGVQSHDDFRTVREYRHSESVTLNVENGGRERTESPSSSGKQKVLDRIVECERIPMPTRAEFFHNYVKHSRPVIITGAMDQWNVFKKWSNEFLRERLGKKEVHIKLTSGGEYEGVEDASLWEDFGTFQIPLQLRDKLPFPDLVVVRPASMDLRFGKFLDMIEETARLEVKNMSAYLEYSSIPQYMPSLEADIPGFPFVNDLLTLLTRQHLNMWLSDGNTLGKLHFDPFDNLLCQISGKKEVILFEPHDNTRLYEAHIPEAILGFNNRTRKFRRKTLLDSTSMVMSPVDILKPNFKRFPKFAEAVPMNCTIEEGERFPKFAEAVPMNCTIEEGEVLYMPAHWWHEVQSYPSSTQHRNLAINFWYEPFLTKEFPCQTCSLDVNPHYRHLLG